MNKHLYRIVFNHALGLCQVVSELVRRPGRGASASDGMVAATVRPVSLSLWVAFGWIGLASVASAQITSAPTAPGNQRPTVLSSPNNAPLVNIQTPSAAGVSRNTYNQFDVDAHGAVLNNSRTNTQSQLAGSIAGNPWLATGTAKVILNEVTGANPSQLGGYIEVAGDRAQVVIANPAGIACDGCGFINANRVTLTTGTPVLNGGALEGYRVTGGMVQINGKGLDASSADYADIIARAVQVNGGIWAPQLQVTTGANEVSVDQTQVNAIAGNGTAAAFALDVSALGGMYANKIQLLGTEHGLGVRNAGTIGAQAGDLVVTADGRLENTGSLQAQGNAQISASGGIGNAGTISASRELTLATPADVDNSQGTLNAARIAVDAASLRNAGGSIAQTSAQGMALTVGSLSNRAGSIGTPVVDDSGSTGSSPSSPGSSTGGGGSASGNGGGDDSSGSGSSPVTPITPLTDGALHIAGLLDNDGGHITAAGGFDLTTTNGLVNDGGQLALRQLTLSGGDLSNRAGTLNVDQASILRAGQVVNDGGQLNFANALTFSAQSLSNRSGSFVMADPSAMTFDVDGTLDNTSGTLASNAAQLTLSSDTLINEHGTIQHAGTGGLTLTTGTWQGAGGTVATAGTAIINAGDVDHQGATLSATQLTLNASGFDNRGGTVVMSGNAANELHVSGTLDNSNGGALQSNADLAIAAAAFGNAGGTVQHAGQGTLSISAGTLNGAGGTIASNGTLTLSGDTADLRNGTTYAQNIAVNAGSLITAGGALQALGDGALNISASRNWDNSGGSVTANGSLQLSAQSLSNVGGTLASASHDASALQVGSTFDNTRGTIGTMAATTIHAGEFVNQGGTVQVAGGAPLTLTADGLLDNSAHGLITSDGDATLSAATLDNTLGAIQHAGQGTLDIHADALNGEGGTIASNGSLAITGTTTDLRNGTTYAQSVAITTGALTTAGGSLQSIGNAALNLQVIHALDNDGGNIAANGALAVNAGALSNQGGTLGSASTDASTLHVAGAIDNTGGTVATAGALDLHAGSLDNTKGTVQSAGSDAMTVAVDGALTNDQGQLQGNGDLTLSAGSLSNLAGTVQAQGAIGATIGSTFDNSAGALIAGGDLSLHAQTLLNRNTLSLDSSAPVMGIYGQHVDILAATFDNTLGRVTARDTLGISGTSLTNSGVLEGTGKVTVTEATVNNTGGQLVQHGDSGTLTVHASQALTNANGGVIGAEGVADLQTGTFDNHGGTTFARHDLTIQATGDVNNGSSGVLQTGGALTLGTSGKLDNSGGTIDATGAAMVNANSIANVGGQLLAGNTSDANAALHVTSTGAIDNRGGTVGNRGGDVVLQASSIDNSAHGTLVAQRDLNLDRVGSLNNAGGTAFATRQLSYQNGAAALDNSSGTFAAGSGMTLGLNVLTDNNGHMQADTLSLTAGTLNVAGGEIGANNLYLTLGALNGAGYLHGANALNAHLLSDYTHVAGQRLESNGVLTLNVDGTLTNQGTLQTQGELDVTAGNIVNQGTFNASASDGSAVANITASGSINNLTGASIQGDTLTLVANDITNTSSAGIVGDVVHIQANTLTNGRDLGTADAAVAYGEGFIGASQSLDIRVAQQLSNLDADIYSGGDLTIAGRAAGTRLGTLDNVSGRIQAQGNGNIAADTINNRRRFIETEQYTLSSGEQYALSSDRAYDNALTPAEQARMTQLFQLDTKGGPGRTTAENNELLGYLWRTGYSHVDHVSDADLAILNTAYNQIAIDDYGQLGGYLVVGSGGNPGAEYKQTDTYLTGTRVTRESADAQILTGGNLNIDLGQHLTNYASTIAATGDLTIGGQAYNAADTRIDNIAVVGQYTVQRDVDALVLTPVPVKYHATNGSWKDDMADFSAHISTTDVTEAGPVLAAATITGRNVSLSGHDINNTAVAATGGMTTVSTGGLAGPGGITLSNAANVQAGSVGNVHGAQGSAVNGAGNTSGTGAQLVGSADHPMPGLVPPSNGMYAQHGDPGSPFLVTTAPRFAKGASTSSDYLLRALGDDPSNIQKRLGDGYYEQQLVLEQLLQLTGRQTLNGGDGMAQYQSLMDDAASEASRLGLTLGAPLTSTQIASLSSDIVWLVDEVVDGQHVLVPVVYLSKATADNLRSDGALIAGNTVNVQATGTVSNDGTINGTQSTSISADTLINRGSINGGNQLAIATSGDTVNNGKLSGTTIAIQAGGDVINAPTLDGLAAHGGSIVAGAGGVQVIASRDVVNQGSISSAGDGVIVAGRDYVQNAAVSASGTKASVGSVTTTGNAAVVAGRDAVFDQSTLSAGQTATITAGRDAQFNAATINGGTGLGISAGRDIVSTAVTDHSASEQSTKQGKNYSITWTNEDTTRGSSFTSGGNVSMQAGHDIDLTAANVKADGAVGLAAGNDVNLIAGADTHTQASESYNKHGSTKTTTHSTEADSTAVGTTISGGKGVAIGAGNDVNATAASITSASGAVGISAGHDVNLLAGESTHDESQDSTSTKSGFLKKTTTTTHDESHDTTAVGTLLSGDSVTVAAGHDLTAQAAQVVADHDVVLAAGNNLTLSTATDAHSEEHSSSKTTSGLMGAGIGIMVGKAKQGQDATLDETTPTGTTVGSVGGSVTMTAGNNVHLTDANVLSDTGTAIVGKNVTIDAAVGTTDTTQTTKQSSSGLTLSLGGAAVSAVTAVAASAHRGSQVQDDRLKALYAAQTAYQVGDAVNALENGAGNLSQSGTDGGINLQLGIGASSASSKANTHDETAYGSNIHSNGNVVIAATGGDLNVIGSQIAGDNVALSATNNINLLSQTENHTQTSSNKNASGGVGIQIGTDGIGFYAQASVGKGSAHGNGTTHAETTIDAKDTLSLVSGGDTTIKGAQAKGDTVLANIGGNLNIASEQDTGDYASKQMQAGGKIVVGAGVSGSASYNQSNTNSHYASVNEVSGIGAGSGGFDIHVNGNTDLKGGVIASTADPSKNLLDTGSLTYSDIQNQAKYSASSVGISGGGASSGMAPVGPSGISPSLGMPQGDKSNSTTKAGIAGGTIVVRDGNADLSGLDRAPTLDNQALKQIFDPQKVQEQQEMAQVAGQVGMRAVGDISQYMADHASNDADKAAWSDGGANKVILHGLVGVATAALSGGDVLGGAAGAAASEATSKAMQDYLAKQGVDPYSALGKSLMSLASTAIGGAVGGGAGATTALQGEQYNRQLHQTEQDRIKQLAGGDPQKEADLSAAACALVHCSAEYAKDSPEYAYYSQVEALGNQPQYADDRALLSQQAYTRMGVNADGKAMPVTEGLFDYDYVDTALDKVSLFNNSYGHPLTRAGGVLQAVGGAGAVATGGTLAVSGAAACPESLGAGCAVAVGGTALGGWGLDQMWAGARTTWNGQPATTLGGYAIQQFGISPAAAELLYGALGTAGSLSASSVLLSASARSGVAATMNADGTLTLTGNIKGLNSVNDFEQLATGSKATPTPGGYINQAKVCGNQCVLTMSDPADQAIAAQIAQSGDPTGQLTESLVNSVAQKQGMTVLDGGKYGSNNGFDAVVQNTNGSVTILIDAKQMTNGTFALGQTADGSLQLSPNWIEQVMSNLDRTSPAYIAIEQARESGTLSTAVLGVNKSTGQLIGVPVKIPSSR
jgi:filamentous hemagglutinin